MLKDPAKLKLGGDKKDLSVLFSDIRGFTTFSESIQPEMLVKLLNEYLTAMTDIIFRYEGTLDKYMGDAIMAIYGAPLPQPDHARRACLTAIDMMDELRMIQIKWEKDGYPRLDIGIGINSGIMVVGNMGSVRRFDYTVMGDSVNLASRLEGLNKIYGTNVIIGEETYERVKNSAVCREIDLVRVKGKTQPVKIYELMAMDGASDEIQSLASAFQKAIRYYRARRFAEAGQMFKQILHMHAADGPTKLYLQRCALLAKNPPPPEWDGVFTITHK
jgi:adenylate cyclase